MKWQLALWFNISWFWGALMRNSMNGNDTDTSFFFLKSADIIRSMLSDMHFMKWHIKVNFAAYQVSSIPGEQTQLTLKKPDRHSFTHPRSASGETVKTTLGNMSVCPMWSASRSGCPSSSGHIPLRICSQGLDLYKARDTWVLPVQTREQTVFWT